MDVSVGVSERPRSAAKAVRSASGSDSRAGEIRDDRAVRCNAPERGEPQLGGSAGKLGELAGEPLQTLDSAELRRLLHLVVAGAVRPTASAARKIRR